jgi:hypothetical protein
MRWFDEVQFAAALAMPEETADRYGTTINGMWADPKTAAEIEEEHRKGRRVLFSVPLIALTPHVYERESTRYLLDETCRDIHGEASEVDWYYWEDKPVYAACIYSEVFRGYLLQICRGAAAAGHDVVNLDEINTSIGLIDRDPGGCGFCPRCLDLFRAASGSDFDDVALRERLAADDELFARYRAFHEQEAYAVAVAMIDEIRSWGGDCAVTANLAYLGNYVPAMGKLWGPMWGPELDFVMMENSYTLEHGSPHLLLPRGSFTPWYRLGSALTGAPTFVIPSILVPKQLAGQERSVYHQLMFLEAYANGGRFAFYWWPGADHETTLAATAPAALIEHIRFMRDHRMYYEEAVPDNEVAILYLDSAISATPSAHFKYVALAQAMAEAGYQFDVLYEGRGDPSSYRTILIPEGTVPGERFVTYPDDVLSRLWLSYDEADRDQALAPLADVPRIAVSAPRVVPTRYRRGDQMVIHLLNYDYDEVSDSVRPAVQLEVSLPWREGAPAARLLDVNGVRPVAARVEEGALVARIDRLDLYGLLVLEP